MTSLARNNPPKIFISYKNHVDPDDGLARKLYEELSKNYSVFRDREKLQLGQEWAEKIQKELREADFLISLLSEESVGSEMVKGEIERAHQNKQEQGHPAILPIRVAYKEPFEIPLSIYLNGIQWTYWDDELDTERLLEEIDAAINGKPLSHTEQPSSSIRKEESPLPAPRYTAIRLESPEGTMDFHSKYYVRRESDEIALKAISRPGGSTIPIKGARQVGKSSLLIRITEHAMAIGKDVVFLDFQLVDKEGLTDADTFYRQFCTWIADELGFDLDDELDKIWERTLSNTQKCTRFLQRHLLKELDKPLVLAMDEVERIFESYFRSDFFSMLRSWHNERARKRLFRKLDLVLVTSTEPYQFIKELNQSPFNIGDIIEMTDFTRDQVVWLNEQHGNVFSDILLERLYEYLHGHPYLTRRAMYLVGSERYTAHELLEKATEDDGPFGDHLRNYLFRLHDRGDADMEELVYGFRKVLTKNECDNEDTFWRLRGAGLVRREGNKIVPRSKLYGSYFKERLND